MYNLNALSPDALKQLINSDLLAQVVCTVSMVLHCVIIQGQLGWDVCGANHSTVSYKIGYHGGNNSQ